MRANTIISESVPVAFSNHRIPFLDSIEGLKPLVSAMGAKQGAKAYDSLQKHVQGRVDKVQRKDAQGPI